MFFPKHKKTYFLSDLEFLMLFRNFVVVKSIFKKACRNQFQIVCKKFTNKLLRIQTFVRNP